MKIIPALVAAGCLVPTLAFGLGFRLPDQNSEATARGNAFTATADNPSAIYYNPAGITQNDGLRYMSGTYAITLKSDVHLDDGSSFDTSNDYFQYIPQIFLTWKPENAKVAMGVGVYAPFGLAIEYPDDTPIRALAHKGSIRFITINPVIAYQLTDTLSLGVGMQVNVATAELERGIREVEDQFRFKGDGTSIAANVGLLWKPHRMHSFGINYRSASNVKFSGQSRTYFRDFTVPTPFGAFPVDGMDLRQDASGSIDFPQSICVGYSFRPTEDWNFEFNYDWTDWNNLNSVILNQRSGDIVIPFNYKSSAFYEFGVTKKFGDGYSVSAGYIYSENSVPNESFNPGVPDSNRHIYSIGVGKAWGDKTSAHVTYQYAHGPTRHIDNGTAANGTYEFNSHAIVFSLGYKF